MMLARRVARPLLASIFLLGGIEAFRHPESKVPAAEKLIGDDAGAIAGVAQTSQIVRMDAAVKVVGGCALALNRVPRLAALALVASMVPTTLAGHRFWEETDPEQRAAQQIHFAKNVSILGGLILAAVDTEARPSARWRASRAIAQATHAAAESGATVNDALLSATRAVVSR